MILRIKIRTPEGMAGTGKGLQMSVLKKLLFRRAKVVKEYTNKDKSVMVWHLDVHIRHYLGIVRNITMFNSLATTIVNNKQVAKGLKRLADTPEDYETVKDLITNGTQIDIIKEADAEELGEMK